MRVWGRIYALNPDGTKVQPQPAGFPQWVAVTTDPNTGSNAWCYVTALCQALLLMLNESPFYADVGLPGQQSVVQQVQPDYYVNRIQQRYAQYFASLIVAKDPTQDVPTYIIKATMFDGTPASATVTIPE